MRDAIARWHWEKPLVCGQVPRAFSLYQEEVNVLFFGQRNADSRQHVLGGTEVEALRIYEDAVIIPQDGLDHLVAFKSD